MSNAILRFCTLFNIHHQVTASYHLQSNGKAERIIQTLKKNVTKLQLDNHRDFSQALQIAAAAYRMVPHQGAGFSPFMTLYGREAMLPYEVNYVKFKEVETYKQAV